MQRTLLLALDGMPLAETAIPLARHLAEVLDARLELLRVVPEDAPAGAEAEAGAYLRSISGELANLEVDVNVARGDPAQCIVRHAARAELIVMTTHARSGFRRAVLGSVADEVVSRSTVPTVLVRGNAKDEPGLRMFLVALDTTCAAPISSVVELARAAAASVVLLRVVPSEETAIWQWQSGGTLQEPQTVGIAREQLEDLAAHIERNGVPCQVKVRLGEVAPTIVAVAREVDADLIVMATHARRGAQRTIVGSVTDAVVHHTCTPVLVARQIPILRRYASGP